MEFKLFSGEKIDDVGEYLRRYYEKYPDVEIYVGCDSNNHGGFTKYATVISLLRPSKGVHVIFNRFTIKRERDLFLRLWRETECSLEAAKIVRSSLENIFGSDDKCIPTIHLDYNKQAKYKSHIVHDAAIGYLMANGFTKVETKSDAWASSFCADMLVNN